MPLIDIFFKNSKKTGNYQQKEGYLLPEKKKNATSEDAKIVYLNNVAVHCDNTKLS